MSRKNYNGNEWCMDLVFILNMQNLNIPLCLHKDENHE